MLRTLKAVLIGRSVRAEQTLETQNAALIIEGKIREAEQGHAQAKRALAILITRAKAEERALDVVETRIQDLEPRIRQALEAGQNDLAEDAAHMLAALENEKRIRGNTLRSSREKSERLRLAIEKTHRQLIDLKQGLLTAKSIEFERRAFKQIKGDISANSAIREGEAVLQRLLQSDDPIDMMESLDEIEAELSGDRVLSDMAGAGFGAPIKLCGTDILARIKSEMSPPKPKTAS